MGPLAWQPLPVSPREYPNIIRDMQYLYGGRGTRDETFGEQMRLLEWGFDSTLRPGVRKEWWLQAHGKSNAPISPHPAAWALEVLMCRMPGGPGSLAEGHLLGVHIAVWESTQTLPRGKGDLKVDGSLLLREHSASS